jgi:hypothetical protein
MTRASDRWLLSGSRDEAARLERDARIRMGRPHGALLDCRPFAYKVKRLVRCADREIPTMLVSTDLKV